MRRTDREITAIDEIKLIIEGAKVLHLALNDGDYPYVVPMHFGYMYDETTDVFTFYTHSAKEGHKIDLINHNPKSFVQIDCGMEIIPSEKACGYGAYFSSFMGKGKAVMVENVSEKIMAIKLLMKNQTGMDFEIDENMAQSVAVIKITVNEYSAKARKKL